jgi:hypothetical protein
MKNTHIISISLIAVSAAFIIVAVLVTLTGGKNKYLIAKKLRLGAIIIGMTGIVNGCRPVVTCYKPAPMPEITCTDSVSNEGKIVLLPNDREIGFDCNYLYYSDISYRLFKGDKSVCEDSCSIINNDQKTGLVINLPKGLSNGDYSLRIFVMRTSEITKSSAPIRELE